MESGVWGWHGLVRWLALIVVTLAAAAVPATAEAALSWSGPIAVDVGAGNVIEAVACPSASQCTAVDGSGQEVTFDPGSPGASTPVEIDPGSDPESPNSLAGVACPSAAQCTAVDQEGDEVTFDPSDPENAAVVSIASGLSAVACPSVSQCTAIAGGRVVTFDPASPGRDVTITVDGAGLTALSCPATTQCTAVDDFGGIVTFDPTTSGVSWAPIAGQGGGSTLAISCPSISQCTAVGDGTEETFDPTAIGNPAWAELPSSGLNVSDVSCPSVTECTTTDGDGNAIVFNPASAASAQVVMVGANTALACPTVGQCTAVGGRGVEATFDPTSSASPTPVPIDAGNNLAGVSCPSQDECVAVDLGDQEVSFDPGSSATPTPNTASWPGDSLYGVDCPAVNVCVTFGDVYGPQGSHAYGIFRFDPTSSPVSPAYVGGSFARIDAVSCPSTSRCTAVLADGTELTFNPSAGTSSPAVSVDSFAGLGAVSCPSVGQCTAMDDTGQEVTFDPADGSLIGTQAPFQVETGLDFPFFAISCPSVSQCTVVDGSDQDLTFNPQQPSFPTRGTIDPGASLDDVSCPAVTECVAVDDTGMAVQGDPTQQNGLDVGAGTVGWSFEPVSSGDLLTAVTCGSASQCVAVDQDGNAFVGTPAGSGTGSGGQGGAGGSAGSGGTQAGSGSGTQTSGNAPGGGGSSSARSAPVNTSLPVISGRATVGQTLRASRGSWTGTAPLRYTYQWQLCTPTCHAIAGAATSRLKLTGMDEGHLVRVVVSASNAAKLVDATSAQSPMIAPSHAELRSTLLAQLESFDSTRLASTLLARGWYGRKVTALENGSIRVLVRAATGPRTAVAIGGIYFSKPGSAIFWLGLSPAGRTMLLDEHSLEVTSTAIFLHPGVRLIVHRTFLLRG